MARKSSFVSTPIGADFASPTIILILLSKALNCSKRFLISFFVCSKLINFSKIETL